MLKSILLLLIFVLDRSRIEASGICDVRDFFLDYYESGWFRDPTNHQPIGNLSIDLVWDRNEIGKNTTTRGLVFPEENLDEWSRSSRRFDSTNLSSLTPRDDRESQRSWWGFSKFAYDVLISDKIGPRRDIPDSRHSFCAPIRYGEEEGRQLPEASIVICYHNEALSVLIRMINGIVERTPIDKIREILLIDDWSDQDLVIQHHLMEYGRSHWPAEKVKFSRTDRRLGLIRCRVHGAYEASGEALVFLDSHCEVNEMWLEPLLSRLATNPKTIAEPIIDIIDPHDFSYTAALVSRGGFAWDLGFRWLYLPWTYFDDPRNHTRPLESPAICGGLFAVMKEYFHHLGDFDTGMDVWGAENIEFSIRVWTCGGRIEVVPCSRVGHVFRSYRPYSNPTQGGGGTMHTNALRTVAVWLDEYKERFFRVHPHLEHFDHGPIDDRLELRERLGCRNFTWYLDNVYPELRAS